MIRTTDNSQLIVVRDVGVAFGARRVLEHIHLSLQRHDFVTIVGPNGAGKSTLLKVLLGLQAPSSGTVHRAAGVRIGYVPQRAEIPPSLPMTVARYLQLSGSIDAALCEETGVADLLAFPLHTLSGGELQRVMLTRALQRTPEVLVLDEPTQHLDMAGQLEFYSLLDRVHARTGCAVVMVSHDLHLVMARTRHVICLYHHICCEGTPQMITQNPAFAGVMGEGAAQLLALYTHPHHHAHPHTHDHVGCAHEH